MKKFQLVVCILAVAVSAMAYGDAITFKDGGDKPGSTNTAMDAVCIRWGEGWSDTYKNMTDLTAWAWSCNLAANNGNHAILIGVKDLFTMLPAVNGSGQTLQINSATLLIHHGSPAGGEQVHVSRMTTNWMPGAPGTNQGLATGLHPTGGSSAWVSGSDTDRGFGSGDWTTVNQATTFITNLAYKAPDTWNVTASLQDIYATGQNFGWVVQCVTPTADPYYMPNNTTEVYGGYTARPELSIDYTYVPEPATMSLLVLGGLSALLRRRK